MEQVGAETQALITKNLLRLLVQKTQRLLSGQLEMRLEGVLLPVLALGGAGEPLLQRKLLTRVKVFLLIL